MRIAYLSADHGIPVTGDKGAAVHIQEVTRALTELGHEVELFAARIGDRPERLAVPVHKLRGSPVLSSIDTDDNADPRVAKERRNLGIAQAAVSAIAQRHAQAPFDLVYERYSLFSSAAAELRQKLGIMALLEVNAPLLDEQRQYRKLALEAEAQAVIDRLFAKVDKVVAVSREVANYVIAQGVEESYVVVVPNGIDPAKFNPDGASMEIASPHRSPVIGFAGSFKPWHGLELLLPAFRQVARQHEHAHLLLVGTGPLESWIRGFIAGAELEDRVTITGWLDNADMPAAIRAMDIATAPYPSMQNFYFSPMKIYEYLACGVPVVARRLGQIGEVVRDGVNGRLIEPQADCNDLAAAILDMCDETLRRRLAQQSVEGSRNWSWNHKLRDLMASLPDRYQSGAMAP